MEEQKEVEEMNQTQQSPWLVYNILFCYKGETRMGNDSERKQHFLQHNREKIVITRKPTNTDQKTQEGK